MECTNHPHTHVPWNKGKLVGQKAPFKPREVWASKPRSSTLRIPSGRTVHRAAHGV